VAWNDDRNRVRAVGASNGACAVREPELGGDRTVRRGDSKGYGLQRRPYAAFERRTTRIDAQVERSPGANEVFVQLGLRRIDSVPGGARRARARLGVAPFIGKPNTDQHAVGIDLDLHRPERRGHRAMEDSGIHG